MVYICTIREFREGDYIVSLDDSSDREKGQIFKVPKTVESILAASGGIGFLIKNSDKFMNHGRIIALQIIILLIGVFIDKILTFARKILFRYSKF